MSCGSGPKAGSVLSPNCLFQSASTLLYMFCISLLATVPARPASSAKLAIAIKVSLLSLIPCPSFSMRGGSLSRNDLDVSGNFTGLGFGWIRVCLTSSRACLASCWICFQFVIIWSVVRPSAKSVSVKYFFISFRCSGAMFKMNLGSGINCLRKVLSVLSSNTSSDGLALGSGGFADPSPNSVIGVNGAVSHEVRGSVDHTPSIPFTNGGIF